MQPEEAWNSFEQSLGKTNFEGFMGAVKYVLQDDTDKRYAESRDPSGLEGPDLFFSQTLEQWWDGRMVHDPGNGCRPGGTSPDRKIGDLSGIF